MGKICAQSSQFPQDLWQIEYTESMENMLLILYPVLGLLVAKGGSGGAEMQREISPNASKISQVGKDLYPIESVPKGFLANRLCRIHGEDLLDVISSTGVAGSRGWLVRC